MDTVIASFMVVVGGGLTARWQVFVAFVTANALLFKKLLFAYPAFVKDNFTMLDIKSEIF